MSYNRTITANFYASDKGVAATLNKINGGLSNTQRMAAGAGGQMGYVDKQVRAIGTTLRYAFAGEVIQRIRMAYQNLEQFQHGLADVAVLGQQANSTLPLVQGQIDELGRSALRSSIMTGRAASDILETYRSLYSSLQNITPKQTAQIGQLLTEGAQISETDPRTLGGALIGQGYAFDPAGMQKNPYGTLQKSAAEFFGVIQRSINITGDQLATFYGRITASAKLAGISQEQMNALIVMISRGGGSPGFFTRNLAQLLQRLPHPGVSAIKAYNQAGITQQQATSMNGLDIMMKLLDHALRLSGGKPFTSAEIEKLSKTPKGQAEIRARGAQAFRGAGGVFLHTAIGGRMQSEQALEILAPMMGAMKKETDLAARNGKDMDLIHRSFQRWLDQDPLESMATAMASFTTDLISNGNPLFRKIAQWTRGGTLAMDTGVHDVNRVNQFIDQRAVKIANRLGLSRIPGMHWQASHMAGLAEAGILGSIAFGTMRGRGIAGKVLGKVNAAKLLPLEAEAAAAGIANIANGSRSAPFWVVIHPLSWRMVPPGTFGGGGGGGTHVPPVIGKIPNILKKLPNIFRRGGGAGKSEQLIITGLEDGGKELGMLGAYAKYAKIAGPVGAAITAAYIAKHPIRTWQQLLPGSLTDAAVGPHGYAVGSSDYKNYRMGLRGRFPGFANTSKDNIPFWTGVNDKNAALSQSKMATSDIFGLSNWNAALSLDITVRDSTGKVIDKQTVKGVNTKFWKDGQPPPNTKGKPVTRRHGS